VPAVQEVGARFGFLAIDVPALGADSDKRGLAEILAKRLARHGIETAIDDGVSAEVVSQLEAHYFAHEHDLRAVLDLAAGAATCLRPEQEPIRSQPAAHLAMIPATHGSHPAIVRTLSPSHPSGGRSTSRGQDDVSRRRGTHPSRGTAESSRAVYGSRGSRKMRSVGPRSTTLP
jgi:hypothetical protein